MLATAPLAVLDLATPDGAILAAPLIGYPTSATVTRPTADSNATVQRADGTTSATVQRADGTTSATVTRNKTSATSGPTFP